MGVRKEYEFLLKRFAHAEICRHVGSDYAETQAAGEVRDEFVSFCDSAVIKSGENFVVDSSVCSKWQNSGYIRDYIWYPFCRKGAKDKSCSVSLAMQKYQEDDKTASDYKFIAKFEINVDGISDRQKLTRFNEISKRDFGIDGLHYIIYYGEGGGQPYKKRFFDRDEALRNFQEIYPTGKEHKRICPVIFIADGGETDDDELMRGRIAYAMKALGRYYDAYYGTEGKETLIGSPAGALEKKEKVNGGMKKTRNIILYGPPGTGKTYSTVQKALDLMGEHYTDYENAKVKYDGLVGDGRIRFVTFHQSFGYEEFIEGIRPSTDEHGNIRYDVKDGVFKEFCKTAGNDPDNKYVFIIDEINRGNISKIFGELITLIEDNKREGEKEAAKAVLPYSGEEFSVPSNVYIIGTMNTADRSITSLDTALRRRFTFEEMMPKPSLLSGIGVDGINIRRMLEVMNERIEALYDREHRIGHAYFLCLRDDPSMDNLADVFGNGIIPLLQEYFFDDYEKIRMVLGDNRTSNPEEQFFTKDVKDAESLLGPGADEDETVVYTRNDEALTNPAAYRKIYM